MLPRSLSLQFLWSHRPAAVIVKKSLCAYNRLPNWKMATNTLPVLNPNNTAQYLLSLDRNPDVFLHYFGAGQLFQLVLSDALRKHLQEVSKTPGKGRDSKQPVLFSSDTSWTGSDGGFDFGKAAYFGNHVDIGGSGGGKGSATTSSPPTAGAEEAVMTEAIQGFPTWTRGSSGDAPPSASTNRVAAADNRLVFLGREVRQVCNPDLEASSSTGLVIQLVLAPTYETEIQQESTDGLKAYLEQEPAAWTAEEIEENQLFGTAVEQQGFDPDCAPASPLAPNVAVVKVLSDRKHRHWRGEGISGATATPSESSGTCPTTRPYPGLYRDFGSNAYSKAHRFVLRLYDTEAEWKKALTEGKVFEKFGDYPKKRPETREIVYLEAEDGCKGTPSPI
ncbi:unnamed protein product [Amoebophrya sp. A120]|nr:unnamed protein product [Amoebophrya sp. A120]|eukprot:GSA120T00007847001.1